MWVSLELTLGLRDPGEMQDLHDALVGLRP